MKYIHNFFSHVTSKMLGKVVQIKIINGSGKICDFLK